MWWGGRGLSIVLDAHLPEDGGRHEAQHDRRGAAQQAEDGVDVGEADGARERAGHEQPAHQPMPELVRLGHGVGLCSSTAIRVGSFGVGL
eukprot:scaffold23898_cov101-Isochrysis_galbana.AAC.2